MDLRLKKYLNRICDELDIKPEPEADKNKKYLFVFSDEVQIKIQEFEDHAFLQVNIVECPEKKREDLFMYLMEANLLGQGTGESAIGLDEKERHLTLSYIMPYEIDYRFFKEKIEDFVNYLFYWREEIEKYRKKIEEQIL